MLAPPPRRRLLLASASMSRAAVLRAAGIPFRRAPTDLDEAALKAGFRGSPPKLALALAHAKAERAAARHKGDALILAADQLLVCGGRLLDKARTQAEAKEQLRFLRGRRQTMISGMALWHRGARVWEHTASAQLAMRRFSDAVLDAYVRKEARYMTKILGGCRFEGPAPLLFDRIDGDYWTILGLPLLPLLPQLRRWRVLAE